MRFFEILALAEHINSFKKIKNIERAGKSTIKINFGNKTLFFYLNRGFSYAYFEEKSTLKEKFEAPFDVFLKKQLNNLNIENCKTEGYNKVILIETVQKNSYKISKFIIRIELIPRDENFIILNEESIVLEALRYTKRIKRTCLPLPLPPLKKMPSIKKIADIEKYLYHIHKSFLEKKLKEKKERKIRYLEQKISLLKEKFEKIPHDFEFLKKAAKEEEKAKLILMNMDKINPYLKTAKIKDFNGKETILTLPEEKTPYLMAKKCFDLSKKLKKKYKNIQKEKDFLCQKIEFLSNIRNFVANAKTAEEIDALFLKKDAKKKSFPLKNASFKVGDFEILFGKNEKENALLLKKASKEDYWFHIKNYPSAHLIVKTSKKELPFEVIELAAKICVNFTAKIPQTYLVDYTKRKYVKILKNAFVTYTNYKTIKVKKE